MARLPLNMPDELKNRFYRVCNRNGTSMTSCANTLIKEYTEKEEAKK